MIRLQKEKILENIKTKLLKFHCEKIITSLDFSETTPMTATRVKNALNKTHEAFKGILFSDISSFYDDVSMYLDLLDLGVKNNAVVVAQDIYGNHLCFIDYPENVISLIFNSYRYKKISNFDFSNSSNIELIETSFIKGINPSLNINSRNSEYFKILANEDTNKFIYLLGNMNKTLNKRAIENSNFTDKDFLPFNLFGKLSSIFNLISNNNYVSTIKNYPIHKYVSLYKSALYDEKRKISFNYPPKFELFMNMYYHHHNGIDIKNILFTSSFVNLINIYRQIDKQSFISDKISELITNALDDFSSNMGDNMNASDFMLFKILYDHDIKYDKFEHNFSKKYEKFSHTELQEFFEATGINSSLSKKLIQKFANMAFEKSNENYQFNSIKEVNIYGVSLNRKDFMLPIRGFTWTEVRYLLHTANVDEFFFHHKDENLTLGIYSSFDLKFNRNDFVKSIVDTVNSIYDAHLAKLMEDNPNKSNYSIDTNRISGKLITDKFSLCTRKFMLHSATEAISDTKQQETKARKKI